jgi:hypothetical protein
MIKKYITDEYLKLCKDPIIQNLVKESYGNVNVLSGDQLDEEIIKICKDRDYLGYSWWVDLYSDSPIYSARARTGYGIRSRSNNPLIAKIKLLKQLLEEQ